MGGIFEPVERIVLQPAEMRLRHIMRADKPGAPTAGTPGVGPETPLLGKNMVGSWLGINGQTGYVSGTYERVEGDEARFSLLFPNGAGDDGVLHRERFAVLSDSDYRPGEEWIEIWKGEPPSGSLVFVGTPTAYRWRPQAIEITGLCPIFPLRGSYEYESGVWRHSPRDVFDHYTRYMTCAWAEDFDAVSFSYVDDNTERVAAGGEIVYLRAGTVDLPAATGNPPESAVRLNPNGANTATVYADTGKAIQVGRSATDPFQTWRAEIVFSRSSLVNEGGAGTPTSIKVGVAEPDGGTWGFGTYFEFFEDSTKVFTVDSGGTLSRDIKVDSQAPGPFNVTIEGRHEWIFLYLDGVLRAVMPMFSGTFNITPRVDIVQVSDTEFARYVDVTSMMLRRTEPYLMTSGTGDYDTPISATAPKEGLLGEYFIDTDTKQETAALRAGLSFAPPKKPYARRIDQSVNFGAQSPAGWMPAGPPSSNWFSARWTGAVKLGMHSSRDWRFRGYHDGRLRLWCGQTRAGEELLNEWPATVVSYPGSDQTPSEWLKADRGFPDVTEGVEDADFERWFPIVIEYQKESNAASGVHVELERLDQPDNWVVLGLNSYERMVYQRSPVGFWKVNEGWAGFTGAAPWELWDHSGNGEHGTYLPTNAPHDVGAGPQSGSIAHIFNGSTRYCDIPYSAALNPATTWTLEAWVRPGALNADRDFFDSRLANSHGFFLRTNSANAWAVGVGNGTTSPSISGGTVATSRWYYIVATYDGANASLYVNNTLVAGPTALTYAANPSQNTTIGTGNDASNNPIRYFNGRVYCVAVYDFVLADWQRTEHYNGMRTDQGYAANPLSPLGVFSDHIRMAAHYEAIRNLTDTFGLQFSIAPSPLESGNFPGILVPETRVGVDTEKVVDDLEAEEFANEGSAEDVADIMLAEGQGISHPSGAAGLVAELASFGVLEDRIMPKTVYESIPDIETKEVFVRRLESVLALRTNVWEQVQARPHGFEHLSDSFPLTGDLALFSWEPGDSIRLWLPEVGIEDDVPRQIRAVSWPFTPGGLGRPSVAFRQRPRDFAELVRRIFRAQVNTRRHYQGSIVTLMGGVAGRNSSNWPDNYSRVNLPDDLTKVVKAEFVVQEVAGGTWDLQINGFTRYSGITEPGRYDVTPWIAKAPADSNRMYARLNETTATGSACSYALELIVIV